MTIQHYTYTVQICHNTLQTNNISHITAQNSAHTYCHIHAILSFIQKQAKARFHIIRSNKYPCMKTSPWKKYL